MTQIVSADHFFMVDGEYKFDPSKLPQAHGACLRGFVSHLQDAGVGKVRKVTILRGVPGAGKSTFMEKHPERLGELVVDNTNITVAEIAPYAALALAYGASLEIITLEVNPEDAKNVHGVPLSAVARMAVRLSEEGKEFPLWWNRTILVRDKNQTWVEKT